MFIPPRAELQAGIAEIMYKCPKLAKQHKAIDADPYVVALAKELNFFVVTQENPKKQNNIVACCREMHVACQSLSQYIADRQTELDKIREDLWGNKL